MGTTTTSGTGQHEDFIRVFRFVGNTHASARSAFKSRHGIISVAIAAVMTTFAIMVDATSGLSIFSLVFTLLGVFAVTKTIWDLYHTAVDIAVSEDSITIRRAAKVVTIPWKDIAAFRVVTLLGAGEAMFKLKGQDTTRELPLRRFYLPRAAPDWAVHLRELIQYMEAHASRERSPLELTKWP